MSTIVFVDREAARKSQKAHASQVAREVKDIKPYFELRYIEDKVTQLHHKGLLTNTTAGAAKHA